MKAILLFLFASLSYLSQAQTIYVNHAATGANNGTSWTDAYTSLQTAISSINTTNQEVWIAAGTYKSSNASSSLFVSYSGIKIYGGFDGTETLASQRNWTTNKVIVSGDILGNDNGTVSFTSTLRTDNSDRLFTINANDAILDGLTFSDAHADGGGASSYGGAILKASTVTNLTIKNCEFINNVSLDNAACIHSICNVSSSLIIENSKFINNLSTYATSIYSYSNATGIIVNVDVMNSLFDGNRAIDNGATKGYAGSAGWIRAFANSTTVNANFTNNTYVNNIDTGTNSYVLNRGTIGLTKSGISSVILNGQVNNCIFWNNTGVGGVTSKAVNNIVEVLPATLAANNSLDSDNMSTISSRQNIVTTNPLFVSLTDFNLTSTSPAVNTGNNTYVTATTDILGNARIVNSTVDMGAYEYGDLCNFQVTSITENTANVSWNSSISTDLLYVISGQSVSNGTTITGLSTNSTVLTGLTQNTYYDVYSSATCSATATSGWYLVSTFKTKGAIYVNHAATGLNDGSSWVNAFTTLDQALQNITSTQNEIRVAQGIYKPNSSGLSDPKLATFAIPNGAKIYGGFNGTESTLAQRNPKLNITTLNGDLGGTDNSIITNTNSIRSDNTFHVISLVGNVTGVVIDGFTISGGNANVINSANYNAEGYGAAIYANPGNTISAQIKNCIIEKNSASECAVYGQNASLSISNTTIDFVNCIVRNNYSAGVTANIYLTGFKNSSSSIVVNSSIVNCLFYNNVNNSTSNQASSCIMTYQNATAGGSYTTVYANIVNCTFANNTSQGGRTISFAYASNTKLINSVIYNNGSTSPFYFNPSNSVLPTAINNIIQGGQLGGTNVNPLFVSSTDFHLTSTSPAINAGNNIYLGGVTADLDGNNRIVGGTVDLGAYEFDAALNSQSFTSFNAFEVYPNPTSSLLNINTDDAIKTVAIYSLEGKLVIESNEMKVDVSNLQNGLYIVKVTTHQNEVGTKKFIKR